MNLKQWSKLQTISIIKKVCVSVATILLPLCAATLVWNQSSHIHTLHSGNQKVVVTALQTGDMVQLDKALFGFQIDENIYGYDLFDRSGMSIKNHRAKQNPLIFFSSSLPLRGSDGEVWGNLLLFWTPPWKALIYFIIAAFAIVGIVGLVVLSSWNLFAEQLVHSLEQMKDFSKIERAPDFIEKIDDLKSVFNDLKGLQEKEISIEKFKAEREKEQEIVALSHKVAHDLRSPMSALNIALCTSNIDQDRRKLVDGALQRMSEICSDLLTKNRPSTFTKENIFQAIDQVASEFRLAHRNIDFQVDTEASLKEHLIPDHEFKSVISNLLNNASDACQRPAGKIHLTSQKIENGLALTISDNGHGIPDKILAELGNYPITYGKTDKGNGLGFYNAKNWVRKHGGILKVSSKISLGTNVSIELPFLH